MSAPTPRSARLAQSPVVLHEGRWWLVGDAGAAPVADLSFATVLDDSAEAVAAADRAVADLRARPGEPSASSTRGRR
ncbi:hypothetical protein [Streptomyces sp. NPDC048350]|uniref:hypothetical protein n=1 Tax=Streptomyces sp. NPDC048350 TaxID=3365538 RepID=UPI00370FD491